MLQKNQNNKDFSRRKFIKGGVALGAAAGLSTVVGGKTTKDVVQAFGKKELDEFPIELNSDFKKGFKQKDTVFARLYWDSSLKINNESTNNLIGTQVGFSNADNALSVASSSVAVSFAVHSGQALYPYEMDMFLAEKKTEFESKEEASKTIKKAVKFLGADLVGITEYDEKWMYEDFYSTITQEERPANLPFTPKSVIVMAIEMDYDAIKTSPSKISDAGTFLGYTNMGKTTYGVAAFVNQLGYKAFGTGNDIAESVPLGIAAGLGELGRNGLLITQEYGPRVRICKVFTEMELAYDKPIEFGAMKFCEYCKRCAEQCPSESIPLDTERNFNTISKSNHPGMKKWYVNVETCYNFWFESNSTCSCCVAACPYNKPNFWHHRLTSSMTSTPMKPFLKSMDELFGYGHTFDEQACLDFWDNINL